MRCLRHLHADRSAGCGREPRRTEETGSTRRNGATENKNGEDNNFRVVSIPLFLRVESVISVTSVPVEAPAADGNRGERRKPDQHGETEQRRTNGEETDFRVVSVSLFL